MLGVSRNETWYEITLRTKPFEARSESDLVPSNVLHLNQAIIKLFVYAIRMA